MSLSTTALGESSHNYSCFDVVVFSSLFEPRHDKTNKMACAPSEDSSLTAWWKLGPLATHWAHSEDSDQTGRVPRLIWDFAGRICRFVGFVMSRLISVFLSFVFLSLSPAELPFVIPEDLEMCDSKWAATWQNQQNDCASSEDSDQPGHPPSLIRVFAGRTCHFVGFVMSRLKSGDVRRCAGMRMLIAFLGVSVSIALHLLSLA